MCFVDNMVNRHPERSSACFWRNEVEGDNIENPSTSLRQKKHCHNCAQGDGLLKLHFYNHDLTIEIRF